MAALSRRLSRLLASSGTAAALPVNAFPATLQSQHQRWASGTASPGLLEMRTYLLDANGASTYMKLCDDIASTRMELGVGFLGMFAKETGGDLNVVRHFYKFDDIGDRQRKRGATAKDERWLEFLAASKPYLRNQAAGSTLIRDVAPATEPGVNPPDERGIYELRNYQLVPGYDTVPKLRKMFTDGLPSKIEADGHGRLVAFAARQTSLEVDPSLMVFRRYLLNDLTLPATCLSPVIASDVGILNNVIELWRYDSPEASIKAREASRKAQKWRECIAGVAPLTQTFTTELLIPTPTSPWQ